MCGRQSLVGVGVPCCPVGFLLGTELAIRGDGLGIHLETSPCANTVPT